MPEPWLQLDPRDPLPLYAQLERGIRGAIATGRLGPGDQLPTVRQLAVELRINANTVARVYADLEQAGVLETKRGVGTFIGPPSPARTNGRRRDADLTAIVRRFLADLSAQGFTADDGMAKLEALRSEGD